MNLVHNQWKSAWSDMRRTKNESWYEEWELPCLNDNGELHYPSLLIIYPDPDCQKMHLYLISNLESVLLSYEVIDQITENFCSSSNYDCSIYNPDAKRSYTFETILLDCSDDSFDVRCEEKVQQLISSYSQNHLKH